MTRMPKPSLAICLLLVLGTLAAYWPITRHEFVNYDDTDYVTQNAYVQAGLSAKGFAWAWTSEVARNWHPVTMFSHMLDCQLFGLRAGGHHLTSLLLHAANAVLLFLLLRSITGATWRSAWVAALFALHPLHVESVAWVAERKDVLSTLFFLLTLWAYASYARRSGLRIRETTVNPRRTAQHAPRNTPVAPRATSRTAAFLFYALALLLFALGLMSKPMLVTLPFVLLLLDYWPLGRFTSLESQAQRLGSKVSSLASKQETTRTTSHATFDPRHARKSQIVNRILEKLPFFALSAASCVVTFRVQQKGGAVLDAVNLPLTARLINAVVSYARYLVKMMWPEHLAALYVRSVPWPEWEVALAAVFLLTATALALIFARRLRYLPVGWFWYLGTLVPVIGLVQVGMQTMADRYTYIPLIGIFVIIAWGGWDLAACRLRNNAAAPDLGSAEASDWAAWRWTAQCPRVGALAVVALAVLAACLVCTRAQLPYWENSERLFQRMIAVDPGNYMAHYNLGNLYSRQDKPAQAVQEYEAALRAQPHYAEAENNLGSVLLHLRRFDEAIEHHAAAVRLRPEYLYVFNLGNAYADAGKPTEAIAAYREALRLDPKASAAHHNLGLVLQGQGKNQEAIAEFRAALDLQPDYESAEHNLANRLAEAGRLDEAIAHYLAAIRLDPKHAENYNGLGICYAMQGKMPEAEQQFREAVRLNPKYPNAQSNLANALGSQNKLAEAISHYETALQIAPDDYQTHFNLGLTLARQGRRAEAKAQFAEALRLHPDYPEAAKAMAELGSTPSASK
ncbi:MAG TPA: tetratricopeptide repeat protein [Candidatus Acidoferrum sp.]|nr:tetratricopeptide repeat protein [Candidatus Acidoferrum sp.]